MKNPNAFRKKLPGSLGKIDGHLNPSSINLSSTLIALTTELSTTTPGI